MKLLAVNIGNPSAARATQQLDWLSHRTEHMLVLTETKASEGCELMAAAFRNAGYQVVGDRPPTGAYGCLIASRLPVEADTWTEKLPYLPERVTSVLLHHPAGALRVVGVYVPARDATPEKTERKRRFLAGLLETLRLVIDVPTVFVGDLNILEPGHEPRYGFFRPFEYDFYTALGTLGLRDTYRACHPDTRAYTWVGKTGDGYRYDHAFTSPELVVSACDYLHETRLGTPRLTDHSALHLAVQVAIPDLLPTSPLVASTEPTLF